MAHTTHSSFNRETEGLEVAKAFAGRIKGKTVLVTGVNPKGIGFSAAEAFASQSPARVIVAGRSQHKLHESINALKSQYPHVDYRSLALDLSSQATVRKSAAELLSWNDVPSIDFVVNSAGVMMLPERTLNSDGLEMTFATNHLGHFLFTCLIMPKLIKAAEGQPKGTVRIINVSSGSPTRAQGIRWSDTNFEKANKTLPANEQPPYDMHKQWGAKDPENASYIPLEGYNQSKVANVLFSVGLNQHLFQKHGILSMALHPGVIPTELDRTFPEETRQAVYKLVSSGSAPPRKTLGAGASTTMVAALDPGLAEGVGGSKDGKENYGVFLMDCQVSNAANPGTVGNAEAERLWKMSEGLVKEKFEF
ncbi:MAG: hypothetical protein Q9162_003848 [Coniocarpon cinnabarinum]